MNGAKKAVWRRGLERLKALLGEMREEIEFDSFHLSRDQQTAAGVRLDELERFLDGLYAGKR